MEIRRIGIISNPIAGRGKSTVTAREVLGFLAKNDFEVEFKESLSFLQPDILHRFVGDSDLLLVAGGDGTLMKLLPILESTQTPVYMLPTGNESLFAKEFGMTTNPSQLLEAVRKGAIGTHFVPEMNNHPFFSMVSVGLDSQVIKKIAESRTGTIRHLSYVLPTLSAAWGHQPPVITLTVDGREVLLRKKGFLVVANNRQYALGIGFVPEADSRRASLAARFFPYETIIGYLLWCLRGLRRRTRPAPWVGASFFEGSAFELSVSNNEEYPIQADGENLGTTPARITVSDRQIRVLEPRS